jgi:HEAT repeat protein
MAVDPALQQDRSFDHGAAWPWAPLKDAEERDAPARRCAVWELGRTGGAAAAPALKRALEDPDVEVRREAVWALARIGGAVVLPHLQEALRDNDPEVRGMAREAITAIRARRAAGEAEEPTRRAPAYP